MVLRKKDDQITFLHVFHHVSMLNIWWFCILLVPGGQSWFCTSLNSLVHVVMYTYYLLNLFPSMKKHLWWKKYITQLQLVQFALIFINSMYTVLSGCDFPAWSAMFLSGYTIVLIFLFGHFYLSAYISGKRSNRSSQSKISHVGGDRYDSNFNVKVE